jgi:hypothetical protein
MSDLTSFRVIGSHYGGKQLDKMLTAYKRPTLIQTSTYELTIHQLARKPYRLCTTRPVTFHPELDDTLAYRY